MNYYSISDIKRIREENQREVGSSEPFARARFIFRIHNTKFSKDMSCLAFKVVSYLVWFIPVLVYSADFY